jgi:hypothetical protein
LDLPNENNSLLKWAVSSFKCAWCYKKDCTQDLTELNNYLQHILKPTIKLNKKAIVKTMAFYLYYDLKTSTIFSMTLLDKFLCTFLYIL